MTITVSIAIPKDIIRLKFVRKFRDNPSLSKTKNVIKKATGIMTLAMRASLNDTKNNIMRKTKAIVCSQFLARVS